MNERRRGSEVSCRLLDVHFRELKKRGLPVSAWIDGVGSPLSHLENKHERIDWDTYVQLMGNLRRLWTEEEIVSQGGAWIASPFFKHTRLVVGALFAPKQFYEWLSDNRKAGKKAARATGGGAQVISCVRTTYADAGPDRLRLDVRIDEGYAPCPEFFLLCKGGFRAVPRLTGKEEAEVTLVPIANGMRFEIRLPTGSDRMRRLHRAIRWITSPTAVANELDDAHDSLRSRYEELDAARAKVALQAAQLRTAHIVNEAVQKNLDLDLTLEAVASALVEEAGFVHARVDLHASVDGIEVVRSVERGGGAASGEPLEHVLFGRGGHETGTLTVYVRHGEDKNERAILLAFVVPSIAMALDDAISYRVLEEYRRGLELRVAERTAELSQARDALTQTVDDLEEAKEVRDRIFANVNHDLRSPLSLILLAVAEARRDGAASGPSARTIDAIEHGARRVLRMVDELLILAEGRERDVPLTASPLDLGVMTSAIAAAWGSAARAAGLDLSADVEEGLVVRADPNALERIFANLISNAVKFTPRGGRIVLTARGVAGARARVEVRDDGPGIDDELAKRLFGRFERGAAARASAVSGSGLGLSLVKELAEALGGSVAVANAESGGAVFAVEIPRAEGAVAAGASAIALRPGDYGVAALEARTQEVYEPPGTPRATILLAEDDPDLRDRTARVLATEYRVLAAPDGLAALELARTCSPDLLVTDIAMPGIDGIELTRRFRELPNNRLAPVLVLSTFGGIGDRLSGFEAGAVDYIHKPFEPQELRARIRSQLMLRSLALRLLETEKLAALGTLSAGLAHEIRNPANGIINAVGPLRELLPPEAIPEGSPAAQLLDVVEHCSRQVAAMSRQLLGFKRNVEPSRQAVPIDTLVSRVCVTLSPSLDGIELRERLDYRGAIHCAEPLLAQVLTNLLQNGAHAAGRGGWVEIRTGLDESRVFVEIRDSGPGVPDDLREKIFEPFFTTKPAGAGTGLGLSTARDIMLRHGGTLEVRRAADRSVFRLELPLET